MNVDHIRGLMRENRLTVRETARLIGLSDQGFYNKMNGPSEFTVSEAQRLAELLHVPITEILDEKDEQEERINL